MIFANFYLQNTLNFIKVNLFDEGLKSGGRGE
jgi:hypothetical protein